jgi:hypothetical protein
MAMAAKLQDHPVQSAPGKGADANFKNPTTALSSSDARQNLKFEREDWTSFRTLEGLQQKADACLVARCASAECPQNRFAVRSRLRPPCPTPNSAEHRVSVQSHPTACAPFHAFRKPRRVIGAVEMKLRAPTGAPAACTRPSAGGDLNRHSRKQKHRHRANGPGGQEKDVSAP